MRKYQMSIHIRTWRSRRSRRRYDIIQALEQLIADGEIVAVPRPDGKIGWVPRALAHKFGLN